MLLLLLWVAHIVIFCVRVLFVCVWSCAQWMCQPSYEAAWGNYMQQVNTWLAANIPNYPNVPHGMWYTVRLLNFQLFF